MSIRGLYDNIFTQLFINDWDMIWHLLKKRNYKKFRNFIWTRLRVRDMGGSFFDPLFRTFPHLAPYPKEIEVEITTRCHLRCIICENTYWKDQSYKKQDLSFEQFKFICEQFPDLRFINVTGEGTCFLNREFFKMLEYLRSRGVYTIFVESFDMFDEEKAKRAVELHVERIEVSLDAATKETYEKIKVGARWDRTIENLKKLRSIKKEMKTPFPFIFFRYIINKLNLYEMVDFLELMNELDMNLGKRKNVEFAGLLVFDEIKELDVEEIPFSIVQKVKKKAKELNINVAWSHTKNCFLGMKMCAKWLQPYIMIGGDVILDCALLMANNRDYLRENRLGNVFEEHFRTIWNSERYKKVRTSVDRKSGPISILCKGCRGYDTSKRESRYGTFE